jgi:hypothetical protein
LTRRQGMRGMGHDPEIPEPWDDDADGLPQFEVAPEWDPSLAGPIYALLARDLAAEEEIDRVLAYLGLA